MDKSLNAGFEFDENAVVGDRRNSTRELGVDRNSALAGLTNKPEGWAAADDVNDIGQLSDDMSRPARARRVATKI